MLRQNPEWLPEYQNATTAIYQGHTEEALLLLEAFLRLHAEEEAAYNATVVRYLLLNGKDANDFITALAGQNRELWVKGTQLFLQTLAANQKLLDEQSESFFFTRWAHQILWPVWQQSQQQLLFNRALEELQALQEQCPDSLTLAWLTGELLRLSPDGGQWRTENAWQEWVNGKTEEKQALAKIFQRLQYPYDRKERATTDAWTLFGVKGTDGRLAEQDRREHIHLGEGRVAPCPGPDCSHHYSSPTLTNHIREQEERQRQQLRDAQKRLDDANRESLKRSLEQLTENENRIAEQNRRFEEHNRQQREMERQRQLAMAPVVGVGAIVKTVSRILLTRLSSASRVVLKEYGHSLEEIVADANKAINKEGLTKAARALAKHATGQRSTGTFPKLTGGIAKQNETARKIVEDIIGDPKATS